MKLVEAVKFLSPYRKNRVIWEMVFSKMLGKQSAKYNSIVDWNKFKKDFPDVNQDDLSHFKLKTLLKDHIITISQ